MLNDTPTRVLEWGRHGPAVVMLHGFPEWAGAWQEVAEALPGCRCIAPDQRGYGQSYRPEGARHYTTGKLAGDVLALLDARQLDRVHLVGHDWGAAVAYATAFTGDPRIASLSVLNGVHPIPFQRALARGGAQTEASQYIPWLCRDGSEDILAARDFARLEGLFAEGMDMSWLTGPRLQAYRAAWHGPEHLRAMINWYRASPLKVPAAGTSLAPEDLPDLPAERMRVTVPHLLIWGMGDRALLPESHDGLDAFCDDLTVHEIAGADHWLHHQRPGEVATILGDFFATHT